MSRLLRYSILLGSVFALMAVCSKANTCTTCYIDYQGGNDSNSGADTAHPWKHYPECPGVLPVVQTLARPTARHKCQNQETNTFLKAASFGLTPFPSHLVVKLVRQRDDVYLWLHRRRLHLRRHRSELESWQSQRHHSKA